ncbi:polyphenol oxidase family protein [Arthrobacter psychrolactophilus]
MAVIDAATPVLTADAAPTVDAMVTVATPGQRGGVSGLAVMVADCVPVVLVGEKLDGGYVMAVAHAGRPGVEKDVIGAVITHMRHAGAVSLEAWLGPSVCGRCYEVPEDMRTTVAAVAPASYSTTSWGTPALDLPAAVLEQLTSQGVAAHGSGICTLEDSQYYSHRRAQRDGESEGRFIGLIAALSGPHSEPLKESTSTP